VTTTRTKPTKPVVLEHRPLPWFYLLVEELGWPEHGPDVRFTPWPETAALARLVDEYAVRHLDERDDFTRRMLAAVEKLAIGPA
jgi:hypothetical protein